MGLITTTGEVKGRKNGLLWLRIATAKGSHKILTLNDKWLPHGSKRAKIVNIEYDPRSIQPRDDGLVPHLSGWTANVRFISVVTEDEGPEEDRGSD